MTGSLRLTTSEPMGVKLDYHQQIKSKQKPNEPDLRCRMSRSDTRHCTTTNLTHTSANKLYTWSAEVWDSSCRKCCVVVRYKELNREDSTAKTIWKYDNGTFKSWWIRNKLFAFINISKLIIELKKRMSSVHKFKLLYCSLHLHHQRTLHHHPWWLRSMEAHFHPQKKKRKKKKKR